MRLGYTDFINKHKTKAIIVLLISILIIFLFPVGYNKVLFNNPSSAMSISPFALSCVIVYYPFLIKQRYLSLQNPSWTFNEYFKECLPGYIIESIWSLIFWFTIISLIIVLVQHFKHKKICKPLLYLPLAFYIIYVIIFCIIGGGIPFVGFYLAIILEVLIVLYCASSQRFRKSHPHKPTNKERIAELERQIAELQKGKDAE